MRTWIVAGSLVVVGCGGDSAIGETPAPLCSDVAASPMSKELFTHAVVAPSDVEDVLVFGGMDPGTLEPINFELGFRLNTTNVPVVSPGTLYLRAIESTKYTRGPRAGETDYGMSFDVCAAGSDHGPVAAVEGELAHVTALAPDLLAYLDAATPECRKSSNAEEDSESCAVHINPGDSEPLIVEPGSAIGTAGGTGLTDYRPGLDANLLDTRHPIAYINPDRIGADEGAGRWFRFGACIYEYFTEPTRSTYLGLVGQNGQPRVDSAMPCGTLGIDIVGTAAGIWMRADKADLDITTDLVGVLSNLLVIGPHPLLPGSKEVISTELLDIVSLDGHGILLEYESQGSGTLNPRFRDLVPGTIYCIESEGYLNPQPFYHYVGLVDADTLRIERINASCATTPVGSRAFGAAAIDFVR